MDNQTAQKLRDAIAKSNSIGVAVGQDPTVDEMAAGLSLYLMLQQANKKVSIASPSEPIVEVSSLVGINRVQSTLSGGGGESGDLVVSFPYNEGEIEKVSYTLDEENGFLNIIVKAGEQGLSFADEDVRFNRGGGGGPIDLLFVVGTPRLADLGNVYDQDNLRDTRIINIDNKEENQRFGDIVMVSPKFSSVSEQIADLALSLGINIDQDAAQNLFSGITYATRNFQDASTSPLAFEMASFLLKKGASRLRPQQQQDRGGYQQQQPRQQAQPQQQQQNQPRQQHGGQQNQQRQQQQQQQPRPQQQQQNQPRQRDEDRIREEIARAASEHQRNQNQNQNQPQRGQQQPPMDDQAEEQPQDDQAPTDWLTPKVYKGSSNF